MIVYIGKMDIRRLLYFSIIFLLQVLGVRGSLYQCLVPFQHCMGSLLPIGYSMQSVDIPTAVRHLNEQCPTMGSVEACTRQYRCSHDPSRQRLEAFLRFFNWLCQNTHVLEENSGCWELPFERDVIACGEQNIAGPMGSRLNHDNHPCPFVQGMVICMRKRMLRRPECSERATELYINIIIQSSINLSSCRP